MLTYWKSVVRQFQVILVKLSLCMLFLFNFEHLTRKNTVRFFYFFFILLFLLLSCELVLQTKWQNNNMREPIRIIAYNDSEHSATQSESGTIFQTQKKQPTNQTKFTMVSSIAQIFNANRHIWMIYFAKWTLSQLHRTVVLLKFSLLKWWIHIMLLFRNQHFQLFIDLLCKKLPNYIRIDILMFIFSKIYEISNLTTLFCC